MGTYGMYGMGWYAFHVLDPEEWCLYVNNDMTEVITWVRLCAPQRQTRLEPLPEVTRKWDSIVHFWGPIGRLLVMERHQNWTDLHRTIAMNTWPTNAAAPSLRSWLFCSSCQMPIFHFLCLRANFSASELRWGKSKEILIHFCQMEFSVPPVYCWTVVQQ